MGRVRRDIDIEGNKCWTLFDSGARNNYIIQDVATDLPGFDLKKPQQIGLGGEKHNISKYCRLECIINGCDIIAFARVLKEIGIDEKGKKIEILIGALTMQEWGIELNLKEEKLDMTHYSRDFVEF